MGKGKSDAAKAGSGTIVGGVLRCKTSFRICSHQCFNDWVVVSDFFLFSPRTLGTISNLTFIIFSSGLVQPPN